MVNEKDHERCSAGSAEVVALRDALKTAMSWIGAGSLVGAKDFQVDMAKVEAVLAASATEGPYAWRCCDDRYPHIFGLVTVRETTVAAWRDGGIKHQPLGVISAPAQSTPEPQATREEIQRLILIEFAGQIPESRRAAERIWNLIDARAKTLARRGTTSVLPLPEGQGKECDGVSRSSAGNGDADDWEIFDYARQALLKKGADAKTAEMGGLQAVIVAACDVIPTEPQGAGK